MSRATILGAERSRASAAWAALVVGATFALRLAYPAAVVLAGGSRGASAAALVAVSLGLALLRGLAADRATVAARATIFDALARAMATRPAVSPVHHDAALEDEIARSVPWVEARHAVVLPSLAANLLALPVVGLLAVREVGGRAAAVGAVALATALVVAIVGARAGDALATRAWTSYQAVARSLELGIRGHVELYVHGLAGEHAARLRARVAAWSKHERRGLLLGATVAWLAPLVAIVVALAAAALLGHDAIAEGVALLASPRREAVVGGLLALTALPIVSAVARGLSELAASGPHVAALSRFVASAVGAEPPRAPVSRGVERVSLRGVEVRFGAAGARSRVVRGELEIGRGEIVALRGANGAGKTTLARVAMGAIVPDAGDARVTLDGDDRPASACVGHVAYLAQQPFFEDDETIREAVRFVAPHAKDDAAGALLARLWPRVAPEPLEALLARRVGALSSGERRLVALARVLLRDAPFVVLDEPEASLDPEARARVASVLAEALGGRVALVVTHDASIAAVATRQVVLDARLPDAAAAPT